MCVYACIYVNGIPTCVHVYLQQLHATERCAFVVLYACIRKAERKSKHSKRVTTVLRNVDCLHICRLHNSKSSPVSSYSTLPARLKPMTGNVENKGYTAPLSSDSNDVIDAVGTHIYVHIGVTIYIRISKYIYTHV